MNTHEHQHHHSPCNHDHQASNLKPNTHLLSSHQTRTHEHINSSTNTISNTTQSLNLAFWLNVSFSVIELIGGYLTNSTAIMLHLLEDVLCWSAVIIGAVVIYFIHWYWVDGLLAICIAVYVSYNAIKNIKNCMAILLMQAPEDVNIDLLVQDIQTQHTNIDITDIKVWSLDGVHNVASLHIYLSDLDTLIKTKASITEITQQHNIDSITIDVSKEG